MSVKNDRVECELAYLGSTGDNQLVFTGNCFVYGITIGNSSTTLEVSDSITDGDGNIKIKLVTPATGYYPVNSEFQTGITVDIANAADVTIHYV